MAERHGLRRLTPADVLAVATACLLLILLVPVLFARPREQSMRALCGANLAQMGKAMFLYAGDNEGILPRAGGHNSLWGMTPNWTGMNRWLAFNLAMDGTGGVASINASHYLLVKYYQVPPRVFVCKADRGTTEFKLSELTGMPTNFGLSDAWDFGPPAESSRHCSYAYHTPYNQYALTTSRDPNLAVAADRSPWIESPAAGAQYLGVFMPDVTFPGRSTPGTRAQARNGNSIAHQQDGQNVLFLDGRVTFETRSYCAADRDNIYTWSTDTTGHGDVYGAPPIPGPRSLPSNLRDSLLVHDPQSMPANGPVRRRP